MTRRIAFVVTAAMTIACGAKEDPTTVALTGRLEAPLVDFAPKVPGRGGAGKGGGGRRGEGGDPLIQLDLGDTALAVERDRHGVESARARLQDLAVGSRQAGVGAGEAGLPRQHDAG